MDERLFVRWFSVDRATRLRHIATPMHIQPSFLEYRNLLLQLLLNQGYVMSTDAENDVETLMTP
jgi:hypothetical protein